MLLLRVPCNTWSIMYRRAKGLLESYSMVSLRLKIMVFTGLWEVSRNLKKFCTGLYGFS